MSWKPEDLSRPRAKIRRNRLDVLQDGVEDSLTGDDKMACLQLNNAGPGSSHKLNLKDFTKERIYKHDSIDIVMSLHADSKRSFSAVCRRPVI